MTVRKATLINKNQRQEGDTIYVIVNAAESLFFDLTDDGIAVPLGGTGITRVRFQTTTLGGTGSTTNSDSDAGSPIAFITSTVTGRVELRVATTTFTKANSPYTLRILVMRSSGRIESYGNGFKPWYIQAVD